MLKYFKNLLTSFLFWIKPPKIGQIEIEPQQNRLDQNVKMDQEKLEVNLDDWADMIRDVFESDNFVTEGVQRANRPSDEILKKQIQLFFKDYSRFNKKVDGLYTKTLKQTETDEPDINFKLADKFNYFFDKGDRVRLHRDLTTFHAMNEYERQVIDAGLFKGVIGTVIECESDLHAFGQGSWYHCVVDFNGVVFTCPAGYLIPSNE